MDEDLGDYRLIEKLGEGAAGEVYLATPIIAKPFAQPGDPVAVKRYKLEILKQARQLERIEKEFRAGSQLSHPNLGRIFEYVPANNTQPPFIVMEYIDGLSLDKWIDQYHPVPPRLLVKFAEQMVGALECLHESGIQHRDLKPQNIMVTSTFDVKIMDLGVIRINKDTPITPKDKFLGTIRNAAPEALFGHDYDERADLYSLGTILFTLLYGEQVYAEEDQFARLTRLIENDLPSFDPVNGDDPVAGILLNLVKKLLSKSPDSRPRNCAEVKSLIQPAHDAISDAQPLELLHGYIATALTGLESDSRDAIMFASSKIADIAKAYDLYVYQPRKATDPLLHKDVDPSTVYQLDRKRVIAADLIIVIANRPSFGVGQEIEIAGCHSIPTIVLVREGTTVSRMVTGSPANILDVIVYTTPEDLERRFRKSLATNIAKVRQWRNLTRVPRITNIGQRLVALREQSGYEDANELAANLGVSPRLLQAIESGDYSNASLHLLEQVVRSLGATMNDLIQPQPRRSTVSGPMGDANVKRLEGTAKKLRWSADTFFDLRDDYLRELAASGRASNLSEENWVSRHAKFEQRRLREAKESGQRSKHPLFPSDANE